MNERDKELAKQAGYTKAHHDEYGRLTVMPEFNREKFADLIRADEREACAKVCDEMQLLGPYKDVQAATLEDAAAAIRARGNT